MTLLTSDSARQVDAHDHPHASDHEHPHTHGWEAGERPPDGGPVVLDIGDGIGALLVHLPDDRYGSELHVRVPGTEGPTIHTGVWRRRLGERETVVAVFPELSAGTWAIVDGDGNDGLLVEIGDGRATELTIR